MIWIPLAATVARKVHEAEHWAAEHTAELTDVQHDFLAALRVLHSQHLRERRRNQAIAVLAVVATAFVELALLLYLQLRELARATMLAAVSN